MDSMIDTKTSGGVHRRPARITATGVTRLTLNRRGSVIAWMNVQKSLFQRQRLDLQYRPKEHLSGWNTRERINREPDNLLLNP